MTRVRAKNPLYSDDLPGTAWVYFIVALVPGEKYPPVKVGYSASPKKRCQLLQTNCPYPLRLLGVLDGDRALEQRIHDDLAEDRMQGEWFAATDRMDKWLAQLEQI